MIQRIQSVYLLITSILTGLTAYFDLAVYYANDVTAARYGIFGVSAIVQSDSFLPGNWMAQLILIVASTLLALFALFKFKNRKLQLKLGQLNYLLLVALILSIYFSVKNLTHLLPLSEIENLKTIYYVGFYLPVAALAFQFLANRGIKKDEALVKSVERLRG